MHKYDPDQYSLILFDKLNRKQDVLLPEQYLEAEEIGERWASENKGYYVIQRTLKNSAIPRKWRWMKCMKIEKS